MSTLTVFIAQYLYLLSAALFVGLFFYLKGTRRWQYFWLSFFTLPVSYLLAKVSGLLFYDPRPFLTTNVIPLFSHVPDNGFPSDHALLLGTLAALATLFNKRLGVALWIIAVLVGGARVLAHVHHAIDILGSFIIAIVATYLVWFLSGFFTKKKNTL